MFQSARLRLTLWYLAILMTVSVIFSIVIYRLIVLEVMRFEAFQRAQAEARMGQIFVPSRGGFMTPRLPINVELIEETKGRIFFVFLLINGGILLAGGGLAYILAGKTLDPIREMMEAQRQFISDASHELKTPLTSLRVSHEIFLRDGEVNIADAKGLLKDNLTEIYNLQSLIETLIQMNRLEYGQERPSVDAPVSIQSVIDQATKTVGPLAQSKQITLISSSTEAQVQGNEFMLVKLLVILLDNAIKYSPADSQVDIKVTYQRRRVVLSVTDQGIGIDKKDIPHIFTRFYRADSARTRAGESGSFGLGLSIAQKIIDLHEGSISVRSDKGKGTTFLLHLTPYGYHPTR